MAFATLIEPEPTVSAWAPNPENLLLLPRFPLLLIIVFKSEKPPDIEVIFVRSISAVSPGVSKVLKFVDKVVKSLASPTVPADNATSTILLLLVKLSLSVINCSTSVRVPVNLTTVLISIDPPPL